jgi:hypothetical protein
MTKLPTTLGELQAFANQVRLRERERVIKLLEDNFYPLDYPRWQADELMDEIFKLIKGEE